MAKALIVIPGKSFSCSLYRRTRELLELARQREGVKKAA